MQTKKCRFERGSAESVDTTAPKDLLATSWNIACPIPSVRHTSHAPQRRKAARPGVAHSRAAEPSESRMHGAFCARCGRRQSVPSTVSSRARWTTCSPTADAEPTPAVDRPSQERCSGAPVCPMAGERAEAESRSPRNLSCHAVKSGLVVRSATGDLREVRAWERLAYGGREMTLLQVYQ